MSKNKPSKKRVPRKLKKAAKGVVRQVRTTWGHIEGVKYTCDEWVNFAIIGRDTKYKRKLIRLAYKEHKRMRQEMIRQHFEESTDEVRERIDRFQNKGWGF